jgi:hypothetical protein
MTDITVNVVIFILYNDELDIVVDALNGMKHRIEGALMKKTRKCIYGGREGML